MSADELEEIAAIVRAALSAKKLQLYRELRAIEECDELCGLPLVRAGGHLVEFRVGRAFVRCTEEQSGAFFIRVGSSEWRGYLRDVFDELRRADSPP